MIRKFITAFVLLCPSMENGWAQELHSGPYRQFGDLRRLHKIVPVLCSYTRWWRLNRTWLNGTYWSSSYGTGMDNMPRVVKEYNQIFSNGRME